VVVEVGGADGSVELFFSILERRLRRNGEFTDTDDVAGQIINFIREYNRHAPTVRWTYDGRPLKIAQLTMTYAREH
jgi:hypothetical protein